jgi:Family of unknown function (DUF5329)
MRFSFKYTKLILLALLPCTTLATPTPATESEVNHLLKFIETTDCQYERNGDKHTGKEAAEHIKKKYDYFKDKIVSAEDFIETAINGCLPSLRKLENSNLPFCI